MGWWKRWKWIGSLQLYCQVQKTGKTGITRRCYTAYFWMWNDCTIQPNISSQAYCQFGNERRGWIRAFWNSVRRSSKRRRLPQFEDTSDQRIRSTTSYKNTFSLRENSSIWRNCQYFQVAMGLCMIFQHSKKQMKLSLIYSIEGHSTWASNVT